MSSPDIDIDTAPVKPPRTTTRSGGGVNMVKGAGGKTGRNPALWQIFFDEKEEDKPVDTLPEHDDRLGKYVRMVDPTDEEYNSHDESYGGAVGGGPAAGAAAAVTPRPSESNGDALRLYPPGGRGTRAGTSSSSRQQNSEVDIVIFDKKRKGDEIFKDDGAAASRPYTEQHWESVDMNPGASFTTGQQQRLIRTESDLELALPTGQQDKWQVRCGYCCKNCGQYSYWNNYWVVALAALGLTSVFVIAILIIWKGFFT